MSPASADRPLEIAVIGAGIAGMSAAWLLSDKHKVTVFESEDRLGGHSHTVDAPGLDQAAPATRWIWASSSITSRPIPI